MSENNESTVSERDEFNESAVMSSLEIHSTPNVGQEDVYKRQLLLLHTMMCLLSYYCIVKPSKKCCLVMIVEKCHSKKCLFLIKSVHE